MKAIRLHGRADRNNCFSKMPPRRRFELEMCSYECLPQASRPPS